MYVCVLWGGGGCSKHWQDQKVCRLDNIIVCILISDFDNCMHCAYIRVSIRVSLLFEELSRNKR